MTQLLTKLTISSMGVELDRDSLPAGPYARVYGIANGTKVGRAGANGEPSIALTGSFRGVNLLTGEEFASGKMYLPAIAHDLIAGQLSGENNAVQFAFDLGVKADKKSPVGYVHVAVPLVDQKREGDPLAALEASLPAPALPAPKKAAKA